MYNSMINTISQQIVDEVTHSLLEDYEENVDLVKFIEKYDYDKLYHYKFLTSNLFHVYYMGKIRNMFHS